MARSDCENDFLLFRERLRKIKPAAVAYLNTIKTQNWVKFSFHNQFNSTTFGEITSNLSEQANKWLGTI